MVSPSTIRHRAWLMRRATWGGRAAVGAFLVLLVSSRFWAQPQRPRGPISTQVWRRFFPVAGAEQSATALQADREGIRSVTASGDAEQGDSGTNPISLVSSSQETGNQPHLAATRILKESDGTAQDGSNAADGGSGTSHKALDAKQTLSGGLEGGVSGAHGVQSEEWRKFTEDARHKTAKFCSSERYKAMKKGGAGYRLVEGSAHIAPVSMYVLDGSDYVSDSIFQNGAWDIEKAELMYSLLRKVQNATGRDDLAFMDFGANIGWFTVYFASRNTSVIAFEAMPRNQDALLGTICGNPTTLGPPRVELHQLALGEKRQSCVIYSHRVNKGNGQINCVPPEEKATWKLPNEMEMRGDVEVYRLDNVLGNRALKVGVAKMDMEGYEGWVIEGGREAFRRMQIPYVVTEFTREGLNKRNFDPARFIELWDEIGYEVRRECGNPDSAIQVDRTARQQCGGNSTCLALVPQVAFAASNEAEGQDLCCVLKSYSQEKGKVLPSQLVASS